MRLYQTIGALVALLCVGLVTTRADEGLASRANAPLTILQINDVYVTTPVEGGKVGGLARVAALKRKLVSEGKNVVFMIAGDFLSPSVASSVFKGKQMLDTL